jgi:PAS domain S-box-containing protein
VETAQSQARLIEAVARFDATYSRDYPGGAVEATLAQIVDAHKHYKGFGKTGEFTLAKREGDHIVFLLSHRHFDLENPKPVPFDSNIAEPMRRALSGLSGTLVGPDYRGMSVLAAHEPVAELGQGIVAKIDLSEIRMPFLKAGAVAVSFAILVVMAGAALFLRVSNPIIRRLEQHSQQLEETVVALRESEEKYRSMMEAMSDPVYICSADFRVTYTNPAMVERTGRDATGEPCYKTIHGLDEKCPWCVHEKVQQGESVETEILSPKDGRFYHVSHSPIFHVDGSISKMTILRDITNEKRAQKALRKAHDELERRVEERTGELATANELLRHEIEVRKRSEEALTESQNRYQELWDNAPVAYHMLDTSGIIKQVNQTEMNMLGYAKDEMVGKPIFDFILPEQRKEAEKRFRLKLEGEQVPKRDDRIYVKKDGSNIYVSIDDRLEYDSDGKLLGVRTTMVDVSERKKAEEALRRANRALKVLSDCNEAVIRAREESEFMKEVCRIIVEDGGYRLAWVGFAEQDDAKTVRPVGQWGFENGYLDAVNITWADTERGRGPTGTAIRTMRPSVTRDIMTEPSFAPWRAAAIKRGYASSISVPLISDGRSIGALNIYAEEPDALDTEEVNLLSNLADDLSYGLMALRAKVELEGLSSRLLEVQESERKRIGRELHDSTGQSLAALKFGLESALDSIRQGAIGESIEALAALIPLVQLASDEVRRIHTDLRPSLLDDLGIIATISWFCREFERLYLGIQIEKQIQAKEEDVPETLKIVIFRVLQEALNNISKYAKADLVRIDLKKEKDKIEFSIRDNGQGFDVEAVQRGKGSTEGFGLTNMRERVQLSGGSFAIESRKGAGTAIRACW